MHDRGAVHTSAALLALAFLASDADAQTKPPPSSKAMAAAGQRARAKKTLPYYGGTVVRSKERMIELLPRANGWIEALVMDPSGAPTSPNGVALQVSFRGYSEAAGSAFLRWDPLRALFAGPIRQLDIDGRHGAVVTLLRSGRSERLAAPVLPVIPYPEAGGVVLAAGPYVLEGLVFQDGSVRAYPRNQETAKRSAKLTVAFGVTSDDDQPYLVDATWNARARRYEAHAPAGVRLGTGPLDVMVRDERASHRGGIRMGATLTSTRLGGTRLIVGGHTVEIAFVANDMMEAVVGGCRLGRAARQYHQLIVNVADARGNVRPLAAEWDPKSARYRGRLPLSAASITWISARVRTGNTTGRDPFGPMASWIGSVRLARATPTTRTPTRARPTAVPSTSDSSRDLPPFHSVPTSPPFSAYDVPHPYAGDRGSISDGIRTGAD